MNVPEVIREKAMQMAPEELEKYINGVWSLLGTLKPGDVLVISSVSKARTRELFIEVSKWYMREHRDTYMDGLTFTKEFEAIQKYDVSPIQKTINKSKSVTV